MKGGKGNPILIVVVAWILVLSAALSWLEMEARREEKLLAKNTASAFFQQIVLSRLWNSSHGGVYVPVTSETQPNPYLPRPNRDLTADNGLRLTKVNPAYMTRQIGELAKKNKDGIQFHITSLNPIRPENKAAEWEERWLKSFEQGVTEQGEFFKDGKITWFRYMAPLRATRDCLKCHARQGYREGDIRGGLSVSLPNPTHTHLNFFVGFGSVAVIGLLFIIIGGTLYERKRLLFNATFNNAIPTCVADHNYTILMANESYWTEFGTLPANKKTIKCYEHRPGASCHTDQCLLAKIMSDPVIHVREIVKDKGGVSQHFIVTAKPLLDSRGKVVGIVESFQDITKRKQAEKALEESNHKLEALSITDSLTGIANRRHFDEVLAQEHARHARSGADLSLIMLDIDNFKSFNDRYGHVNGDECLRQVARVLAESAVRPADLAARYGGEEFVCILPETDCGGAVAIAEKIRQGILARAIPHQGSSTGWVTASLGVITVKCSAGESAVDIISQADELLYRAKSSGRNRVESVTTPIVGKEIKDKFLNMEWKDSFCCGNQLIDSQHRAIVHLANELLEAILSSRPSSEISAIIARLLDDVSQHFRDEEAILKTIGFPGRKLHAAEHAKLLAKGRKLSDEFKASTLTVGDVFQYLAYEVVMLHMLEADQEFYPFISQGGMADPNPMQQV